MVIRSLIIFSTTLFASISLVLSPIIIPLIHIVGTLIVLSFTLSYSFFTLLEDLIEHFEERDN